MLEAVGEHAQRERLRPGERLLGRGAIGHAPGKANHLREPALVILASISTRYAITTPRIRLGQAEPKGLGPHARLGSAHALQHCASTRDGRPAARSGLGGTAPPARVDTTLRHARVSHRTSRGKTR
jgi:hypothetical protein